MNTLAKVSGILCFVSLALSANARDAGLETTGQDATPATAEIVNCGEIQGAPSVGTIAAPQTAVGHVRAMPALATPTFKPGCPNIEAAVGTRFGIQVVAKGAPGLETVSLVTRVTHPEMRNPKSGQATTVDQWASPMNAGIPRVTGWSFDEPWELVPGRWRIEILDEENKVLAAKVFVVSVKNKK